MRYIIIILMLITIVPLKSNYDSLLSELPNSDGIPRAIIYTNLAKTYEQIDPKLRMKYAEKGYRLAQKYNIDTLISSSLMNIGISYFYMTELDSAQKYFTIALKEFQKENKPVKQAAVLNNLSILQKLKGNYQKAINYLYESMAIKEKLNDVLGLAIVYNNLGSLNFELNRYDEAIKFFNKSLLLNRQIDKAKDYYQNNTNLANVYIHKGFSLVIPQDSVVEYMNNPILLSTLSVDDSSKKLFAIAEEYLRIAEQGYDSLNYTLGVIEVHITRSTLEIFRSNFDGALQLLEKSVEVLRKQNKISSLVNIYTKLGWIYYSKNDYIESIANFQNAIDLSAKFDMKSLSDNALNGLSQSYEKSGNFQKAYYSLKKFIELTSSLRTEKTEKALDELNKKYQTEKKDVQLDLARKKEEILNQRIVILVVSLLLLLTASLVILVRSRYKGRMNKLLQEQNNKLKELNTELAESQTELKAANNAKDKFFSILSHDLRSPMSVFRQATKYLLEEYDNMTDDDRIDFLKELKESSSILYSFLENLLAWSKTQTGTIPFHTIELDLQYICNDAMGILKMNADKKSISMINVIPHKSLVMADANMLSSVIYNLLSNAIKFTDIGGSITVSAEQNNGEYRVKVKDTGRGMDEDTRHKLFRIDKSVTKPGTQNEKGSGLGLLLCKEFVEKHGGKISVKSEVDQGTEISFTIPKDQ